MDPIYDDIKCECPPDRCAAFVDPPSHCVHRLDGVVVVLPCETCKAGTWHQNGKCLKCGEEVKDASN